MEMSIARPNSLLQPLVVPQKLLMGPGPSNCSPRVLQAMGLPVLGHLHPECVNIMDEVKEGLQYVFQTNNRVTLAISASGHGGMEAALSNLVEPGDTVLIAVNGIWGERASNIAHRYGGSVKILRKLPGEIFTLGDLEKSLIQYKPVLFFVTQGESSTGVYQPLDGFGDLCSRYNCLLVLDTVASLGAVPVHMDQWKVDVIYSGSQKILGAPPGLAPISFSPRALKKVRDRQTPVPVFYWDIISLGNYWACFDEARKYHHTVSSSLLYGLREGLAQIVEEGLENCWKRHEMCAKILHDGIKDIGLQFFVNDEKFRLPSVTALHVPDNIDAGYVSKYAMDRYRVEISGGLGPTFGKVIRIGLMGHNATTSNVQFVLKVLKEAMQCARCNKSNL